MNDPRFIPPSDREKMQQFSFLLPEPAHDVIAQWWNHATYMDERDARHRDLIRRLAEAIQEDLEWCESVGREPCRTCKLIAEARGIEATNE